MSFINKLLNIALPLATILVIPILMLPLLIFKILLSIKNFMCPENLATKVVLITGSASGIGEQLAYEYGRQGAFLSLVDIKKDKLVAVADKARSLGSPHVIIIGADVSKVEDCKRFVDETVNYFGHLDHLVNNAGIAMVKAVENCHDVSMLSSVMDVNFWGAVYGTLFAIPHLKKRKGKIVVIASACGWYPLPTLSFYNASKAAMISFFETLRTEVGWAIGITIVTPGMIKTDLCMHDILDIESSMRIVPMGTAVECAKAVLKGVCRGDMYVTEPSWVKMMFPWKLLFPQFIDSAHRLVFRISSNNSGTNQNLHLSHTSELKAE
ncbi:11-beta-hydroxysteroid dehydrogenase-like 4A isoform X1 [Senna tora]|uniref:11-beta-hydroxysteroid dehydrogenase-like 4A isoform X1 n=1 Tax=Senna tora TaxID=362788 RepID=A0A835C963_9FABA|nr:11-beta-hydroxysteroid dehydrogenase-like 4A isoform X1 [Senna tora]